MLESRGTHDDRRAEANPFVLGSSSTVTACGIGAGMLPAVAASVAANVVELLKMSPKFVLLSLRLGLAVSDRAHAIEEAAGSWSLSLLNVSSGNLSMILENFHETNVCTVIGYSQFFWSNLLLVLAEP